MATTKAKKVEVLQELRQGLSDAKSVTLVDLKGLTFDKVTLLRKELKKVKASCTVVKKTLLGIALSESLGQTVDVNSLEGNIAVIFSMEDAAAAPKVVKTFARKNKSVAFRAGVLEGAWLSASGITAVADLPTREQLLARLLGSMLSPVSGFAGVLHGTMAGFVRTLDAVRQQKSA